MKNKIKIVLAMVVMLSLAGSSQAGNFWATHGGDWAAGSTWDTGVAPLPGQSGDVALLLNGGTVTVTTAGQGAQDCALGYSSGTVNVNIAADITWEVTNSLLVGHDGGTGILNIYGTAQSSGLRMSTSATSSGTINVYDGGSLNVGMAGWGIAVGEAGTASINLKGTGNMEIGGDGSVPLAMNGHGHIDIEAGQLKMLGDWRNTLQGYINNGWITSHGGGTPHCSPIVSYLDGYTYVKTTGCTCVTYLLADLNHDCYVDMLDLAFLAQNWLVCTVPTDPNCVQ